MELIDPIDREELAAKGDEIFETDELRKLKQPVIEQLVLTQPVTPYECLNCNKDLVANEGVLVIVSLKASNTVRTLPYCRKCYETRSPQIKNATIADFMI